MKPTLSRHVPVLPALLFLTLAAGAHATTGEPGNFWSPVAERQAKAEGGQPQQGMPPAFQLDEAGIRAYLSVLPEAAQDDPASLPLMLPDAEGGLQQFEVSRSAVMSPGLAAKYPQLQTFKGVAVDGSAARLRFEVTPLGFSAMAFDADGGRLIERNGAGNAYVAFERGQKNSAEPFTCGVTAEQQREHFDAYDRQLLPEPRAVGPQLRVYRTAIAATGEYTAVFGGRMIDGLAAVVSATNRINQIYETDLGLRLELVPDNDLIIYTDGGTDPYTNSDGLDMLEENRVTLSAVIGNVNFDFGHVFSTGGGGVAGLGVICTGAKAEGVTGLGNPRNDPFWVDYVAHEMGHQLNGPHTFNAGNELGASSGCGNQRSGADAFEVGSGTTIMAYAGICPGQNTANNSDAFFHVSSLNRIHTFTQSGSGSSCGTLVATGNNTPTLLATPGATIPARTPFALTANAFDPDGDALTYLWEQFDLGAATTTATVVQDLGSGPLFRSFEATSSPTRLFPRLQNILSGTATIGEILPTTNRTVNFRVTVRDNRLGGGGVQWSGTSSPAVAQTTLNVVDTGAAFAITTPSTATNWDAGDTETVEWNVAGTEAAPIACSNVDIDFSLDRGQSFPINLASAVPNSGSADIGVPSQSTGSGRVRISCSDNIFFNINTADISVTGGNAAPVVTLSGGAATYTSNGPAVLLDGAATVSDVDSANLVGGVLRVTTTNNGDLNDRLEIRDQGVAPGEVGVVASTVSIGGIEVGTFTGGVGVEPLQLTFSAAATPADAQAVLRNVTFRSTRDIAGTMPRTLQVELSDGDGGHATPVSRNINIVLNADPFLFSIEDDTLKGVVTVGDPVTYTLTFSKQIDLGSVSAADFDNPDSAEFTIDTITQPQSGVLQVVLTPTATGLLTVRVPETAEILDSSGLAVPVPFEDDDTLTVQMETVDTTAPEVFDFFNSSGDGLADVGEEVVYTLAFTEEIGFTTLTAADFANAGSAPVEFYNVEQSTPGAIRVRVRGLGPGTLVLQLIGGDIEDLAGNALVLPVQDPATVQIAFAEAAIFSDSFEAEAP